MNAKYALALILILQVSMCLCARSPPSQELVDKYNTLKTRFLQRLVNLYRTLQELLAPLREKLIEGGHGGTVRDFIQELHNKPEFKAFVQLATGLGQEVLPLVDEARGALLGLYEHHLRPHVGDHLSQGLEHISSHLDKILPAEETN